MRRPRGRLSATAAALVLGLSLGACSDDASGESGDAGDLATSEQLADVLIPVSDVPSGFVEGDDPDDGEATDTFADTCLEPLSQLDDALELEPEGEAEIEYAVEDEVSQGQLGSAVGAFGDQDGVRTALDDIYGLLSDCTTISTTDDDGTTIDLEIDFADDVTLDGVDQQLTFDSTGTITGGTTAIDIRIAFVYARVGPYVSIVSASEITRDFAVADRTEEYAQEQVDRLADLTG